MTVAMSVYFALGIKCLFIIAWKIPDKDTFNIRKIGYALMSQTVISEALLYGLIQTVSCMVSLTKSMYGRAADSSKVVVAF